MDSEPAPFRVHFYRSDGQPWEIPVAGVGRFSSFEGIIAFNGSLVLETSDIDPVTTSGWAELETNSRIGGMGIFRSRDPQRPDAEAVVPFTSRYDDDFLIPFDNQNGFVTSVQDARERLFAILQQGPIRYERIQPRVLEIPLVWDSDLKTLLLRERREGRLAIDGMRPNERTPKKGHVIRLQDEQTNA